MRRPLFAGVLLVAAAAVAATALAGRRSNGVTGADLPQLENVSFISVCTFSHRASDDPIVYPGQPNRSHDHSFFGNVSTDAVSTPATLREAPTTCDRPEDTAAYWAPTLLVDDKPVPPVDATVYYRRRTLGRVRAFPPGLEIVAGNSHATAPQRTRIVWWDCGTHGHVAPSPRVPTCPAGGSTTLRLNVRFPDCWDGTRLDSPDHQSHMAYSSRGVCPPSRPVAVPSITLIVQYPIAGGAGVTLASSGELTGHADFVNAWQQAGLERLVQYCLNALRTCGHTPA
jgi:hypothetical protein